MAKRKEIRNSTAEFLIFQAEDKGNGVEVMYQNETIWCSQKAIAELFDVGIPAISKHLSNIYETGELRQEATISKMETVRTEDSRHNNKLCRQNCTIHKSKYAMSRSLSPTMVAKYHRHLIPKEIVQKSLKEFCTFLNM